MVLLGPRNLGSGYRGILAALAIGLATENLELDKDKRGQLLKLFPVSKWTTPLIIQTDMDGVRSAIVIDIDLKYNQYKRKLGSCKYK